MKSLIIPFLFLTFCFPFSCDRDQTSETIRHDEEFIGTWTFCSVDSCFQYVIQNPETYRITLSPGIGIIRFCNDGTGSIISQLVLYCNYDSFTWQYKPDTLSISGKDSYSNRFSSEVEFIAKDTMLIKLQSCIDRRGIRVWYEITSARNIVK